MPEASPTPRTPSTRHSLAGDPAQVWSLRRAVDALAMGARAAGRPTSLWLVGIAFPSIGLGIAAGLANEVLEANAYVSGTNLGIKAGQDSLKILWKELASLFSFAPLFYFVFRLQAGLARIAPPRVWEKFMDQGRKPRLRDAWRHGRGLAASACGLFVMLSLMVLGVLALLYTPALVFWGTLTSELGKEAGVLLWIGLVLPGLAFLSTYAVLLSILQQLALQSLASNRRGVTSAMTHAWSLARRDPWSTVRTVAVGLMIDLAIWVISVGLWILGGFIPFAQNVAIVPILCLWGFAGVTRAVYWAAAYQALGGLLTDECSPRPPFKRKKPGQAQVAGD